MAVNIGRAFSDYGWCARIHGLESGGLVEGLPTWNWPTTHGDSGSLEVPISDRHESELSRYGLMPLVQLKSGGMAAFLSAHSMHQPANSEDPAVTAAARLGAMWPYLLACNRFMLYLNCIVRDKIGSFKDDTQAVRGLNHWLLNYVDGDPEQSSEETKAKYPLAAAEVVPQKSSQREAFFTVHVFLRPQYQLAGLDMPLELVARMPKAQSR